MDWQELTALVVVGVTVAVFAVAALCRRRGTNRGSSVCGCGDRAGHTHHPPTTVLRGKKGERPELVVKWK